MLPPSENPGEGPGWTYNKLFYHFSSNRRDALIFSTNDCFLLQKDLTELISWSRTWGMAFNIAKCSILLLTNVTKKKIKYAHEMDGKILTNISTQYLGVILGVIHKICSVRRGGGSDWPWPRVTRGGGGGGGGRPDRDVTVGFQNEPEKKGSNLSKLA